jgi:hypothetical protein
VIEREREKDGGGDGDWNVQVRAIPGRKQIGMERNTYVSIFGGLPVPEAGKHCGNRIDSDSD